ncbi:hypothetical protein [Salmonella phage 7-11]|uniref:Uncharacterized protein n=1 Tax=Salmonella phage 7-11 TaxID=1054968 RepID=G0X4Y8_9CAUD|nr:hypothetical protein SaPh711_gp055 [Salmonella phage 7-11]AEK81970.1 hypothetical protein [Salmonella phage 7-11]
MGDDYYVWPDGTWCYGHDIEEYLTFMSMDLSVKSWYSWLVNFSQQSRIGRIHTCLKFNGKFISFTLMVSR